MTACDLLLYLQYLEQIRQQAVESLRVLPHSPSVQMQQVPPDMLSMEVTSDPSPDERQPDMDARCVCVCVCAHVLSMQLSSQD